MNEFDVLVIGGGAAGLILTVCDNTFATPILQRPLEFGFDIVMHSATKYLGGHSDAVGGILVTSDAGIAEQGGRWHGRDLQIPHGSRKEPKDRNPASVRLT